MAFQLDSDRLRSIAASGYGLGQVLPAPASGGMVDLGCSPGSSDGFLWNGLHSGQFVLPQRPTPLAHGTVVIGQNNIPIGVICSDGTLMVTLTSSGSVTVPIPWPVYTDRNQIPEQGKPGEMAFLQEDGERKTITWMGDGWQRLDSDSYERIELPETIERQLGRVGVRLVPC